MELQPILRSNKKYITFPVAKLAKEKGYDESIRTYFDENGKFYHSFGSQTNLKNINKVITAPTKSELQIWLIDNHNIIIAPYPIGAYKNDKPIKQELGDVEYSYYLYIDGVQQFVDNNAIFNSYEDALEHGLYVGLDLIVIPEPSESYKRREYCFNLLNRYLIHGINNSLIFSVDLIKWLKEVHNIDASIEPIDNNFRVIINSKSSEKIHREFHDGLMELFKYSRQLD